METDKDSVSVMQESVDQLALSMFDSLRLIPFVEEVSRSAPPPGQPGGIMSEASVRRAINTDATWLSKVQSLAEGVLKKAKTVDSLIDTLPGSELSEDQQMEASVRDI